MIYLPGSGWFYRCGSYRVGRFNSLHRAVEMAWYDPILQSHYARRAKCK